MKSFVSHGGITLAKHLAPPSSRSSSEETVRMFKALRFVIVVLILGYPLASPSSATAQTLSCNPRVEECLCDPSTTDCRRPLLDLIADEDIGIDVGFWFMEDSRFSTALAAAKARGVAVRVLVDTKANSKYPGNVSNIQRLADAGIPIRRAGSRYLHWKMMLFTEHNVVEFGSANYSPSAFVYQERLVDFQDETVLFSNDVDVVNSFKTRFDDAWVSSHFVNHANPIPLARAHGPGTTIDPELNIPPFSTDLGGRSVARYRAESAATGGIDTIIYRIGDTRHTDEIVAAIQRGVPIRIILEPSQYRNTVRYTHSAHADRIYAAVAARGEPWRVRHRRHLGENHQKLTLLRDQRMAIFGSQNWTTTSGQYEHNYFTTKQWMYDWYRDQFERKFNSDTETEPFVPLPPAAPSYRSPSTGSQVEPSEVTLRWYAGLFAHKYDVYFGTSSNPPLVASDLLLGPSDTSSDYISYTVGDLAPDTTYYWKVVSKTMANVSSPSGGVWNFRTGAAPQPGAGDVVLWAARASTVHGNWTVTPESTAAGGGRLGTANAGVKVSSPLASPAHYFEMSFTAAAGVPYRLWLRGRASSNSWASDSAFVQFSDSVTSSGAATWRIGSTSATTVTIEDCTSCGLSAWGWNDNWTTSTPGALGPLVYFAESGEHTVRIQMREDGLAIDQIVLSRDAFLTAAPGTTKNDGTILPESGGSSDGGSTPPPTDLPPPWVSVDVGAVGPAGSATHTNGTFTVRGGGADVWGTTDAFHYAYRPLSGDGSIVARVASLSGSQSWVKVGVMIRASTSASAAHAFMLVSNTKGLAFQYRPADGASTLHASGGSGSAPRWVRLERTGDVITASLSSDGTSWTLVGSGTFTMPENVLIGLVSHSHTTTSLATATFDNVTVVP
jgi:hypothetical protein